MTILMLAMHPHLQTRAYEEIRAIGHGESVSYDDIVTKMPFTEMALKETMRLFPVVGFAGRQILSDVALSDITLPKWTICILPFLKFHRDPKIWGDDADVFDPERFTPERSAERDPFFYMPFSAGPRNCIGQRYAMASMKTSLFHLLQKFEFVTDMKLDELQFSYMPFFELANEYAVKLRRRK